MVAQEGANRMEPITVGERAAANASHGQDSRVGHNAGVSSEQMLDPTVSSPVGNT